MGKHCAPAVEREHEAVGEAVCGPAGGGRSVGEDSVGEDSVGGRYAAAAAAVGEVDVGASAGSLTAAGLLLEDKTDCGRCSPEQSGDVNIQLLEIT